MFSPFVDAALGPSVPPRATRFGQSSSGIMQRSGRAEGVSAEVLVLLVEVLELTKALDGPFVCGAFAAAFESQTWCQWSVESLKRR